MAPFCADMSTVCDEMAKATMAVTKTADNSISFLRFMRLSFRDLSFARDTMDGAPDGQTAEVSRDVIGLLQHGPTWQEMESAFLLDCRGGRTPES
jgi:hypothetical protein